MTAKEYLSRARTIDAEVRAKREQIRRVEELAASVAASVTVDYSEPRVQGGQPGNRVRDYAIEAHDLTRELREDIKKALKIKREIGNAIRKVPDAKLRTVLELYYLCGYSWPMAAREMHYAERWIYELHRRALKHIIVVQYQSVI